MREVCDLCGWLPKIDEKPALRKKVLSFVRDYQRALSDLSPRLKDGAFCFSSPSVRGVSESKHSRSLTSLVSSSLQITTKRL